ncbi:Os01g0188733 [Oryza sativa Japonica Group]|nr:Os01g0188733 [Oryza sativa Japonica Group]
MTAFCCCDSGGAMAAEMSTHGESSSKKEVEEVLVPDAVPQDANATDESSVGKASGRDSDGGRIAISQHLRTSLWWSQRRRSGSVRDGPAAHAPHP